MEYYKDDFKWDPKAKRPLKIMVVGAGIAGLAAAIGLKQAGHDVAVYEQVNEIKEVGAGIQMAPNNTRILGRFGVLEEVLKNMSLLGKNSLRRWKNNEELSTAPLMPGVAERYNAPLGVIHRGDLQRILFDKIKSLGVPLHTGSHISKVDDNFEARIQLPSGEWITGDLVIAADGIKSGIRGQIAASHQHVDKSMPTGDAAYRILIPKEKLEHDERALALLNQNVGMRWMGPGGHIMGYPIKNNQVYNMVLLHPQKPEDNDKEESWTRTGDKNEMMEFYKEWNDLVRDLLTYVPEGEVREWTLNSHRPLPSWQINRVVLVGDACHPMLPYVAQGAAQAIEDAGALQATLSLISSPSEVPTALAVYEKVRKPRGERIQQSAGTTQKALHLPDGREQQLRDEKIREAGKGHGTNPDKWSDPEFQDFMWGVDIMKDIVTQWDELSAKVEGHHLHGVSAGSYV